MTNTTMRIDDRYQGFPDIALGGISGGRLARQVGEEVEVVFKRPIPTGTELGVVATGNRIELVVGGEIAATASPTAVDLEVPEAVSLDDATVASHSYFGYHEHPYPACFTCGTERDEGDGLRIFPGPVDNGPLVAGPWTPHTNHAEDDGTVPPEFVWAAFDCPSIWALIETAAPDSDDRVVTGRLAVRYDDPIHAEEPHVVLAWPLERQSGIWPAGAAILDEAGSVRAVALHTLVITDWGVPLGLSRPG